MTRDDIEMLYLAQQEANTKVNELTANKDRSFEDNLAYQMALKKYGKATNAYEKAVSEFVDQTA